MKNAPEKYGETDPLKELRKDIDSADKQIFDTIEAGIAKNMGYHDLMKYVPEPIENVDDETEALFEQSGYTLDLAGLTQQQRESGSIFLGGSQAEFVESYEDLESDRIDTVVFRWGDERGERVFAELLENTNSPSVATNELTPTTVIKDQLWHLSLQSEFFDPESTYEDPSDYILLEFDEDRASEQIEQALSEDKPAPEILGKVDDRYVAFSLGLQLAENATEEQPVIDWVSAFQGLILKNENARTANHIPEFIISSYEDSKEGLQRRMAILVYSRANLALRIGEVKQQQGIRNIRNLKREKDILEKAQQQPHGMMTRRIMERIIGVCRQLQNFELGERLVEYPENHSDNGYGYK